MKKKLSLCIIAGNVERYIGRFLDSFGPLADEIIVVRSIGDQGPDRTLAIAEEKGCSVGHYFNRLGSTWPHVDDFAAARNMAFDMASHDLIMWADTDDVIDAASIAAIREAIELLPDDYDGIEFAYDVPEDGLSVFRERIIRKGRARWVSPIHETLKFNQEPKLARVTNARILHMPSGPRQPNDERNLRILESIPKAERTTSHRFHLFQSLRAVGRIDEAITEITDMLGDPPEDIGQPEKYELFVAAGQLSDDPNMRSQMMLQALGTDPSRREAYGELALCMIGMNRGEDALGLTTAMRAVRRSGNEVWNERAKYYGYLGEQLHGMALRSIDLWQEADAIETNHFIRHGAKISLIHATRGRTKQAVEARRKWFTKAKNPDAIEHIFGIDVEDPNAVFLTVHNHVILSGKDGSVAAWNAAASKSQGQVLVQMSDDWEPPLHWDELILSALGDLSKPAVLAISDGARTDPLLCMAIMTRQRYKDQGFMFHPDFFSVYSDDWFTECAYRDGVVIEARDIVFEHMHPAFRKAPLDTTYERGNSEMAYRIGKETLDRLRVGDSTGNGIMATGGFKKELHAGQLDSPDLAKWLSENLDRNVTVNDLGCGNGFIVDSLTECGFAITGYEADPIKESHRKCDLSALCGFDPGQTVCIEVGEHIPAKYQDMVFDNIERSTARGCLCVLSWALPGQEGRGHVNCLPNPDVVDEMGMRGFTFLAARTKDIRESINDRLYLKRTLMVFLK